MPFALLQDRTLVSVSGAEASQFLQNILTINLDSIRSGEVRPGALLTPQGKILFDFLISRKGENAFLLECRKDVVDDFMRRLALYKLRAKAEIVKVDQELVTAVWQNDSTNSCSDSSSLNDARFSDGNVKRHYSSAAEVGDLAGWHALRIANGVAESGSDYQLGDAFPHDVLLDQNSGVDFKKGCYVGQEVVSRMHHRGTARRRVLIVSANDTLPPAGTELTANGRSVGTLGSVADRQGLAIARIDRIKDAMDAGQDILAGDLSVTLEIPNWATFTFPQAETAAEST